MEKGGARQAGLRSAFLAGPAPWRDPDAEPDVIDTVAIVTQIVTVVVVVVVVAAFAPGTASAPFAGRAHSAGLAIIMFAGAMTVLVGPSILLFAGRRQRRMLPSAVLASIRLAAIAVAITSCVSLLKGSSAFVAILPGIGAGAEATLTTRALGAAPQPLAWWRRFELSSMHLGMLLVVAAATTAGTGTRREALTVYASVQVVVAAAVLTAGSLEAARRRLAGEQLAQTRSALDEEHRRLANWLHDDVTSTLRLARLRLSTKELGTDELSRELEELDHRIRLRQLDEVLASGNARLAEILQPFIRLAREHSVEVVDAPRLDEMAAMVDGVTGRQVARVLSVLVPNAIQAAATCIWFHIAYTEHGLVVEVEDDAGGFDLADVPAGRALDGLRHELGEPSLRVALTAKGSRVSVRVPRGT